MQASDPFNPEVNNSGGALPTHILKYCNSTRKKQSSRYTDCKMKTKFVEIFSSLPSEAQQILVEKHLSGILDQIPREKSKKILAAATRLQNKYKSVPELNLRVKRMQISSLFDELSRDSKTSFIKERSNRDELLREVVQSLTNWLNDIWSVVFEHNINYLTAHTCLLFVADALTQLSDNTSAGGCKCPLMNLSVEFSLKNKKGKTLKMYSFLGPKNIDRILLWIWRDLLVSLLAKGSERDKKKLPDLLEDIESILGVSALGRLLYGGLATTEDEDEDDYEDIDEDEYLESTDEGLYSDDESAYSEHCSCSFHASYWSHEINEARLPLRASVEDRLITLFKVLPSVRIYRTLMSISQDVSGTEVKVDKILSDIAGDTPDNLVAALDIHILNGKQNSIATLLKNHSYLLRPRDLATLQCAVAILEHSPHNALSISILEKELNESLRAIYAMVSSCFCHIEEDANRTEMSSILKLRHSSVERQDRIAAWIDHVATSSGNGPLHPMTFAAMMMGLPVMPGADDGDDSDLLNFVDLDQHDPDLEDLREEYRPNLKGIFDGWVHLAQRMKGGPIILAKLYVKAVEMMPWLRGSDIVNEMINKLQERPNKMNVMDALTNLSAFSKLQRKKLSMARNERDRRAKSQAQAAASTSTVTSNPPPAVPPRSSSITPPPPLIPMSPPASLGTFPPVPGGMEDVD